MPLTPCPHATDTLDGEVVGVCGGRLWPILIEQAPPLQLWMAVGTSDALLVQLDMGALDVLLELLGEARARMMAGTQPP